MFPHRQKPGFLMTQLISFYFRFAYVVFETADDLEKAMAEKQETEFAEFKVFLDYTDERSKYRRHSINGPGRMKRKYCNMIYFHGC